MRVAVIQHDIVWADREANFARLRPLVAEAAAGGARLVLLSEMFSTGFVVDRDDIGEPTDGPSSAFLAGVAAEHGMWVGGSCPETRPDDPRPFNSFVLASPDGSLHRYAKIHPFTYGGEHRHFRAGSEHLTVQVDDLRVSMFVCYDLRFADEFWGLAGRTDLYLVPANWPSSRREHWMALLRARAIENQAWVMGANRVGDGGGLTYCGDSRIVDPLGNETVAGDGECIIYADITPGSVTDVRGRFPFLQDRRD